VTDTASYPTLRVDVRDGVARATIDHPPINLLDAPLMADLAAFGQRVATDDDVRVVVLDSADPEFFIAHADIHMILALPETEDAAAAALEGFHDVVDRFRTMPKVTIACLEGRARGGGSEIALAFDMRFGTVGRTIVSQPEVAVGIIPGGGGTQRLPRLVGRARALEIVLGAQDFTADVAERYGYLNRALPEGDLRPFVDALARRIASFPAETLALAKESVGLADTDLRERLTTEARLFARSLAAADARARMESFLAAGGQTREVELEGFPDLA
jgi:enoyl-CoA hydratase/carnithine racemase